MKKNKLNNLLAIGSVGGFIGRIGGIGAQFGYSVLIVRLLSAEALGTYSVAFALSSFMAIFIRLGMDTGGLKIISESLLERNSKRITSFIINSLSLYFLASIPVIFLINFNADYIFDVLNIIQLKEYVMLLIIMFIFLGLHGLVTEWIRGFKKICLAIFFQNLSIYLIAIFSLLLLLLTECDADLIAILSMTIALVLSSVSGLYICLRPVFQLSAFLSIKELKYILLQSLPLMFINLTWYIMTWTDVIMLSHLLTAFDVGIYSAATRIAMVASLILISFNSVFPVIVKDLCLTHTNDELQKQVRKYTRIVSGLTLFICLSLVYLAPYILGIYGDRFEISGQASLLTLVIGRAVGASAGSVGYLLIMTNNQNIVSVITVLCGLVNIVFNYVFIKQLGILGAALATAMATILWNLMASVAAKNRLKIIVFSDKFWENVILVALSILVFAVFNTLVGRLFASIAALATYGLLFFQWILSYSELISFSRQIRTSGA